MSERQERGKGIAFFATHSSMNAMLFARMVLLFAGPSAGIDATLIPSGAVGRRLR
ncbi:MAG: hypothetical protein JO331_03275 [Verrucomicrobia bacterium]|nr:hypothetical protein [Verrucomicrobiota bacterium]